MKYIDICSEDAQLEWVDPESEEPIDYVEIIEDIEATVESRKIHRQGSSGENCWRSKMIRLIIFITVLCILGLLGIGITTVISWI